MSTTETAPKVHAFAHLGAYPYRYLGFEHKAYQACHGAPVQPGGTCDHCGTPISDIYSFVSADASPSSSQVANSAIRLSASASA